MQGRAPMHLGSHNHINHTPSAPPAAQVLEVEGLRDDGMAALGSLDLPCLEEFSQTFSEFDVPEFARARWLGGLRSLSCEGVSMGIEPPLIQRLSTLSKLDNLALSCDDVFYEEAADLLASVLPHMQSLRTLALEGITVDSLNVIAPSLGTNLRSLQVAMRPERARSPMAAGCRCACESTAQFTHTPCAVHVGDKLERTACHCTGPMGLQARGAWYHMCLRKRGPH